jgi:hypothetical protein
VQAQAELREAIRLGKPIRIVRFAGVRFAEDALQGATDIEIVDSQGAARDAAQIYAWRAGRPFGIVRYA